MSKSPAKSKKAECQQLSAHQMLVRHGQNQDGMLFKQFEALRTSTPLENWIKLRRQMKAKEEEIEKYYDTLESSNLSSIDSEIDTECLEALQQSKDGLKEQVFAVEKLVNLAREVLVTAIRQKIYARKQGKHSQALKFIIYEKKAAPCRVVSTSARKPPGG